MQPVIERTEKVTKPAHTKVIYSYSGFIKNTY